MVPAALVIARTHAADAHIRFNFVIFKLSKNFRTWSADGCRQGRQKYTFVSALDTNCKVHGISLNVFVIRRK